MEIIEGVVKRGGVVGVDLALALYGLVDHVMFVYGFDEENLYVFDTHQVSGLEYEKISPGERYMMKLPKSVIKNRWKKWSRVWELGWI